MEMKPQSLTFVPEFCLVLFVFCVCICMCVCRSLYLEVFLSHILLAFHIKMKPQSLVLVGVDVFLSLELVFTVQPKSPSGGID
jgi:hypothetical protein